MSARLRICHLASGDLWAGAEAQVRTLLCRLVDDDGLELAAVVFNDGRLAAEARSLGVATTVLDERKHGPFTLYRELVRHLRAHPADVLHTHGYKENVLGAQAARSCGVRRVVRTLHGWPEPFAGFSSAKMRLFQALDRWTNRRRVDRLIAVSEQLRDGLLGFDPGRVVCIHNGVEADALTPDPGPGAGAFVVGAVGRLTPVKAHADLLRAMPALIAAHPEREVRLVLVGDGPLEAELRALANGLGISERVEFTGHLDDCLARVARMSVVAFPSLSEGIPMALLEALALARPVVATRVGGLPEVVRDGENGLLVEPADPAGLSAALARLLADAGLAARLGRAGRETVLARFSAKRNAERTAEIYRELGC